MITNTERMLSIENRNERPYIVDDNLEKCMSCSHVLNYISKETRVCHFCGMPIDFQNTHFGTIECEHVEEIPKELETCSLCGSKMFFNSGCASCPSCGNSLCLNG